MKTHRVLLFTVASVCLFLAGCGPAGEGDTMGTALPSPTNARAPTSVPPLTSSPTTMMLLTNTADPAAVATTLLTDMPQTATIIPSATPDVPLSKSGPWLVFVASVDQLGARYLWAINADGSGLTRLVEEPVLSFKVRPYSSAAGGAVIAYITGMGRGSMDYGGYTLKLLSLPGGEARTIIQLDNASIDPEDRATLDNLLAAIDEGGLAWSSDGSGLAFVWMLNDSSVDAYSYDYTQGGITRMSSLPTHSYDLGWSPDGNYLTYREFVFIGMSGPEEWGGHWAVKADGTGAQLLSKYAALNSLGWLSSTDLILERYIGTWDNPEMEIYTANIETGDTSIILRDKFDRVAFSKEHNTWLLAQSYEAGSDTPLVMYQYGTRTELPVYGIMDLSWSGESDVFFGKSHDGPLYTISPGGEVVETPVRFEADLLDILPARAISPDGEWWAWHAYFLYEGSSRLWVGKPMAIPLLRLASDGYPEDSPYYNGPLFTDMTWSPDSQRLLMLTLDHGLLSLEQPDFEPVRVVMGLQAYSTRHSWQTVWIH